METGLLLTVACLFGMNLAATWRILGASNVPQNRKRWIVAAVWIAPLFGTLVAFTEARAARPRPIEERGSAGAEQTAQPAPTELFAAGVPSFQIAEHMAASPTGLPVLDWAALHSWINGLKSEADAEAARARARRAWLLHFRDAMGPAAFLLETDRAMVLSTLEPRIARATAEYIERTRKRVGALLNGVAEIPERDKSILIVLDNEDDYYDYVSIYYPAEGEFAFSGGMFINAGCPHFVVVHAELSSVEPVIAHELTHSALAHLHLPKWLDEGIAVNTEIRLTGEKRLIYTPRELHEKHLAFWNEERIQEFWSGHSFDRTDDGNLLSYELGRIIVEQMARNWDTFLGFVRAASRSDGGASAAQSALATELGHFPSTLLGLGSPSSWSPRPDSWVRGDA